MPTVPQLKVPFIKNNTGDSLTAVSSVLDGLSKHKLDCLPWPAAYPYKPLVSFSIAYTLERLLLKYYVVEKDVRANCSYINGPVYNDSCVEFFISFNKKEYYNLEFNCIGKVLGSYGKDRHNRSFLPEQKLKEIQYLSCMHNAGEETGWELTLSVPLTVFIHDVVAPLNGKTATANFYKCGDELPVPHYLSWSDIQSPEPDFHLSQFFGQLIFE